MIAYGLWSEKSGAIKLAIVDAILGIAICIGVMLAPIYMDQTSFTFRLELLLLIPYLLWLFKTSRRWESSKG